MAQEINHVPFFRSYYDAICALDDDQKLSLCMAILRYAFEGETTEDLPSAAAACFLLMRPTIDKSIKLHTANAENGRKGGLHRSPSKTESQAIEKRKPSDLQATDKRNRSELKADKDKDKDKDKEEDKEEEEGKEVSCSTELSDTQTAFTSFWSSYPRKVGKKDAEKAFAKAIQRTDLDTMLAALKKQRTCSEWQRNNGQYIPHPATWLNGDRWQDDLTTGGGTNGGLGSDPLGGLRFGLHL